LAAGLQPLAMPTIRAVGAAMPSRREMTAER
jgi:hypothetical protein